MDFGINRQYSGIKIGLILKTDNSSHFLNTESYKSIPLAAILLIVSDELFAWNRPKIVTKLINNKDILYQMDLDCWLPDVCEGTVLGELEEYLRKI